jgi:hypothetical protein
MFSARLCLGQLRLSFRFLFDFVLSTDSAHTLGRKIKGVKLFYSALQFSPCEWVAIWLAACAFASKGEIWHGHDMA